MPSARRRALAAGLLLMPLAGAVRAGQGPLKVSRPLMGTQVDIVAHGGDPAALAAAVEAAYAEMARREALLTRFSPTSEAAALGLASGLQPVAASPELRAALRDARRVSEASGGDFDVTVGAFSLWGFANPQGSIPAARDIAHEKPLVNYRDVVLDDKSGTAFLRRRGMRVDLGGIAKLPILQAGLQVLRQRGVRQALVNGGGDVGAFGGGPEGRPWRVGVRDPRAPERLLGVVSLQEGWVASSGDYERSFVRDGRRYHHILDPRSGQPTEGLHGVTLVAPDVSAANGLGAALMVGGWHKGQALLPASTQALVVQRDGSVRTSTGWGRVAFAAA